MSYSASRRHGREDDHAGRHQPRDPPRHVDGSGCEAADFAGFPAGNIALMQRGTCDFAVKVVNAQTAGASRRDHLQPGQRPRPHGRRRRHARRDRAGRQSDAARRRRSRPSASRSPRARASPDEADPTTGQIVVDAESDRRKSTNVLADTPTGNPDNVTIVGSHLDSVPEGPGINDNGIGLGVQPRAGHPDGQAEDQAGQPRALRLVGRRGVRPGRRDPLRRRPSRTRSSRKIAANLNFDMLASPNHANFVYDGDFSDTHAAGHRAGRQPGRGVHRGGRSSTTSTSVGVATEPTAFDGRSDYKPFQDNGVAAGGLFSGAEVAKTAAQAAKWGGTGRRRVRPVLPPGLRRHRQPRHGAGYEQLADGGAHVTGRAGRGSGRARVARGRRRGVDRRQAPRVARPRRPSSARTGARSSPR